MEKQIERIPVKMPVVALRGMTILPQMVVHFDVSRERSVQAVERAMIKDQKLFVVAQKDPQVEEPGISDLYAIGTICIIKQVLKLPNKIVRVMVEGSQKATLTRLEDGSGYLLGELVCEPDIQENDPDPALEKAMQRQLQALLTQYVQYDPKHTRELLAHLEGQTSLRDYIEQLASSFPMEYDKKQRFLEANGLEEQYEVLVWVLQGELEVLEIQRQLQEKVQKRVDKNQKEYILKEQQKVIQEELEGELATQKDTERFSEQVDALEAGEEVKVHIRREIGRLSAAGSMSADAAVIRTYIETLLALPWEKAEKEQEDITQAKRILEEDHYGLDKVKERVMEFLAVRTMLAQKEEQAKKEGKDASAYRKADAPIICLVGPPGTGKTSIAKSIARAMNKEYVRICLGGVRDEAEIRGHRRTYVGAMPGRIVDGLRQAGVKNPLMLLDEIDKVSSDYKGDTSSALLEVLDGEQNSRFRDHYVELPIDLSEVLFIATANSLQPIPRPLLDRMEVIELGSYTGNEKLHIARQYLLPKQISKNGLDRRQISIADGALKEIIASYTREAGVRGLERKIGEICRKAAMEILQGQTEKISVTKRNIERYLGKPHFREQKAAKKAEVGIVRGLAWTSVGGDTLEIEVNVMPGKGQVSLTGQLGDVMKESAQTGISYIRSISGPYHIAEDYFQNHDIHIHIPAGSVPKDGPSAGITMATAMLSAVTGIPVRCDVAMTGEITLRGRVLPIGGLKEKTLAAKNAGSKTIIVPLENKEDIEELDKEITDGLEFVFVTAMKQVIECAFVKTQANEE